MKKLYFTCLSFIYVFNLAYCQATLLPETMSIEMGDEDENETFGYILTNTSDNSNLEWVWCIQFSESIPEEWEVQVCDMNTCWAPGVDCMPSDLGTNVLGPNERTVPSLHYIKIYNRGVAGEGIIQFCIYDDFSYNQEIICTNKTVSTSDFEINNKINLFPNPTSDFFNIIEENSNLANIEIYNVVGKKIKEFSFDKNVNYDVSTLKKGLYLVRMLDYNNTLIRSQRLSVR